MPSSNTDRPLFTTVDWTSRSSIRLPDRRTVGFIVVLAIYVALFAYDYTVSPDELVWFIHWDLSRMDWLYVLSMLIVGRYVVFPLAVDPARARRTFGSLLRRPIGVLVLAFVAVFSFVGIMGPDALYPTDFPVLEHQYQPPMFASVDASDFYGYTCTGQLSNGNCFGSMQYPLGTNRNGQDILHLVIEGIHVAFMIGLTTAVVMAAVATTVGTLAGYYGGLVDDVLMGYVDIQQTIPAIVVYIVLATMYFGNIEGVSDGGPVVFVLVFGLLDWGGIARVVRSEVQVRRSSGYVRAARVAGASNLQIVRKHVVPNTRASIIEALTRRIPLIILAQVALAYLNLNHTNAMSLGELIRLGLDTYWQTNMPWHQKWWVSTFPVIALVLTVLAFNLLGDLARDALDPQEADS